MKFPDKIQYNVTTNWDKLTGGTAYTSDHLIKFDTPAEYEGNGKAPCPDQLFLASITGCVMDTFLNFKKRFKVETFDIRIDSEMDIKMNNQEGYRIEEIRIRIKVFSSPDQFMLNRKCAELALDFCHITKTISAAIPIIGDIELVKV